MLIFLGVSICWASGWFLLAQSEWLEDEPLFQGVCYVISLAPALGGCIGLMGPL